MSKVHKLIVAWYFHVVTNWDTLGKFYRSSVNSINLLSSSVSLLVDISRTFLFVTSRVVHKLGVQLESFSGRPESVCKGRKYDCLLLYS